MSEHFDADYIHTTPEGRHFRHGDGAEVDEGRRPLAMTIELIYDRESLGDIPEALFEEAAKTALAKRFPEAEIEIRPDLNARTTVWVEGASAPDVALAAEVNDIAERAWQGLLV